MRNRTIGLIAGIIAFASTGLHYILNLGIGRLESATTLPSWMPFIETFGTTVTLAHITVDVLEIGVPLALAVGVGYYLGHRVDVARGYASLVKVISIGSTLGILLGMAIVLRQALGSPLTLTSILVIAGTFLRLWMQFAIVITLGILAGATFVHFRTGDQPPAHPTEATTETQSAEEGESETRELDSQPTQ